MLNTVCISFEILAYKQHSLILS